MEEVIASQGADFSRAAYFGDNENDIDAWSKVRMRIGINLKKPELCSYVDHHFPDFYGALKLFDKELKELTK
ncbi:hypothetical protein HZC32_02765 [Candidatus Woesearchaeota archaeon]|nr:hypothetical protein [Candidatus Woesearchaeota archaeon]